MSRSAVLDRPTDVGEPETEAPVPDGLDISDEELAAEALAAAPVDVLDDDAVSWWEVTGQGHLDLLPAWYMPSPRIGSRRLVGWKRVLAWSLVLTFLAINAAGLCSTYGRVLPANL